MNLSVFILLAIVCASVQTKSVELKSNVTTMSEEVKCILLNLHNNLRKKAFSCQECSDDTWSPRQLEWSETLAELAYEDAKTCFDYVDNRYQSKFYHIMSYGLLGEKNDETDALVAIIAMRHLEGNVNPYLFENTSKMGCAFAECVDEGNTDAVKLVCRYDLNPNQLRPFVSMCKMEHHDYQEDRSYEQDAWKSCLTKVAEIESPRYNYRVFTARSDQSRMVRGDQLFCKSRKHLPGPHEKELFCRNRNKPYEMGWFHEDNLETYTTIETDQREILRI